MRAVLACALVIAISASGCSGDADTAPTPQPAAPPPTVATPAAPADRSQRVFEAYYRHCREFTWQALVYPQTARNQTEAARKYAGPPRRYQRPAFRGCLAGLRVGKPRIDLAEVKRLAEAEAEEHGED